MSGYLCPHCDDIISIFGQGGGEDFCRREEERKESTEEGMGGGCRFLGKVPIDRELVALLDGSVEVDVVAAEGGEEDGNRRQEIEVGMASASLSTGQHNTRKETRNLVERYQTIPSFKIVRAITQQVMELIQAQKIQ